MAVVQGNLRSLRKLDGRAATVSAPDIFMGESEHVGCRYGWILHPPELARMIL